MQRKQRAAAAEPSRARVSKYGRDGIIRAAEPSSYTVQMQHYSALTPRAVVRPQRIPSTWERSLRNDDSHGAATAGGGDGGGGGGGGEAVAKPNTRASHEDRVAGVSTAIGSLNLVLLPEQGADGAAAQAQWTELNTTWYRT